MKASEPDLRVPTLSHVSLESRDGQNAITLFLAVFSSRLQKAQKQHQGMSFGRILSAGDWLEGVKDWVPLGDEAAHCLRHGDLSPSPNPRFRFWGQARCRRSNFVVLANFASRHELSTARTIWGRAFPRVVLGTKTTTHCLTPEEMTHLADFEGPPFATRHAGSATVDVAATSMCGSGGCPYFRYAKVNGCYQFVEVVRGFE